MSAKRQKNKKRLKRMVIVNPEDTEVYECGTFDIYPKKEGYSVLDTRHFLRGFHEYRYVRRDASFWEKIKILFARY